MPHFEQVIFHLDALINFEFLSKSYYFFILFIILIIKFTLLIFKQGLQSSSSFKIERQTAPEGYILG